ncbi:MAG: ABC transporter ATP-binding protein [Verrucomicrobiota bacterium]
MAPALKFQDVNFRYGENCVLRDVSFEIEEGICSCVIGPNGGGKTTLLKLALGILKPETGDIRIFDHHPHIGCKLIGYVPQYMQFDPKFPVTALEVVLMGRLDRLPWWGRFGEQDREAALAALAEVGLKDCCDRPFAEMSGGQKQRVLIARALVTEPRLLLLDEPTANIDLSVEEQFLETLRSLPDKMTIMMVSHDLGLVERLTETVLCVNRKVHHHKVAELDGKTLREIYSGELRKEHFEHHHDHG